MNITYFSEEYFHKVKYEYKLPIGPNFSPWWLQHMKTQLESFPFLYINTQVFLCFFFNFSDFSKVCVSTVL